MLIGLTGQIGAGKSTVADILTRLGAVVIDADSIGKAVVNLYPPLQAKLAAEFGEDILEGGGINRRRLASRAFRDEESKTRLDKLVHPYLLRELRGRVARAKRFGVPVVVDAALLLQWKLDRECQIVIGLFARESVRVKRLLDRGLDRQDIAARMKLQSSAAEIRAVADYQVTNDGSPKALESRVRSVWSDIFARIDATVQNGDEKPKKKKQIRRKQV